MFCVGRAETWHRSESRWCSLFTAGSLQSKSLPGKSLLVNLTRTIFQKGNWRWLRQLSKSVSRCFCCPGVLLASHFFPGLLQPPGFQDSVVCIPGVLLWEEGDVECTQQLWGPETRKEKQIILKVLISHYVQNDTNEALQKIWAGESVTWGMPMVQAHKAQSHLLLGGRTKAGLCITSIRAAACPVLQHTHYPFQQDQGGEKAGRCCNYQKKLRSQIITVQKADSAALGASGITQTGSLASHCSGHMLWKLRDSKAASSSWPFLFPIQSVCLFLHTCLKLWWALACWSFALVLMFCWGYWIQEGWTALKPTR